MKYTLSDNAYSNKNPEVKLLLYKYLDYVYQKRSILAGVSIIYRKATGYIARAECIWRMAAINSWKDVARNPPENFGLTS